MRDDSLPDADRTLEAPDATYDERDLAGEIHLLDHEPDANLLSTAGAARDALYDADREPRPPVEEPFGPQVDEPED